MPVTVGVNMMGVIHATSNHMLTVLPDTCLTPTPAGPVPIPYPNFAMSSQCAQTSTTVLCDGLPVCLSDSTFFMSSGDEAGVNGGVASGSIKGKAEFVSFSFDVQFEGKNVTRSFDMMLSNNKNTPPMPVLGVPVIVL